MKERLQAVLPDDFVKARREYREACDAYNAAKDAVATQFGVVRAAQAAMLRVCPHLGGFHWNGLGSQFGSNQQCDECGMYEADAVRTGWKPTTTR